MFQDGATPLFLAAQEGHVTVIRQLLSSGAKVNQPREVMLHFKGFEGHGQSVSLFSSQLFFHISSRYLTPV